MLLYSISCRSARTQPYRASRAHERCLSLASGLKDLRREAKHFRIGKTYHETSPRSPTPFRISSPHDAGPLRCMLSATPFTTSRTSLNNSTVDGTQNCLFPPISTTRPPSPFFPSSGLTLDRGNQRSLEVSTLRHSMSHGLTFRRSCDPLVASPCLAPVHAYATSSRFPWQPTSPRQAIVGTHGATHRSSSSNNR
jgi:hypothetical protein